VSTFLPHGWLEEKHPSISTASSKYRSQNHRLEKTSKIIQSNHLPNITMPTKP